MEVAACSTRLTWKQEKATNKEGLSFQTRLWSPRKRLSALRCAAEAYKECFGP